jgi:murein tripeptide amidase MpaA
MVGYLTPTQLIPTVSGLANQFSRLCAKHSLGQTVSGGRALIALEIHNPDPAARIAVVVTGGVHAREWAPPDALVSFARKLLIAGKNNLDVVYPSFTSGGITYSNPHYVIPKEAVAEILNRFNLIIFPLVNPDGRHFSMTGQTGTPTSDEQMWRTNRRFIGPAQNCVGVDINRNFGVGWDHHTYYRPDAAAHAAISEIPCPQPGGTEENYKGPAPFSEAETQAVRDLVLQQRPSVFLDVHLHGREIQYPWGMDHDQITDSTQNFRNSDKDHKPAAPSSGRDGKMGNAYGEFIPDHLLNRSRQIANTMAKEILISAGSNPVAQLRSTYRVDQSVNLTPDPNETFVGCADDWAFSRQFSDPTFGEIFAFTIEAGKRQSVAGEEHDGGFFPTFDDQYPKVEQEIHAALFGLLTKAGL